MLAAFHVANVLPGAKKLRENMKQLKEAVEKCEEIAESFTHFTVNEWIFDNKAAMRMYLSPLLTDSERRTFNIDVTRINWKMYIMNFAYGIKRFILKEEAELPSVGYNDVISVSRDATPNILIVDVQQTSGELHPILHNWQASPSAYTRRVKETHFRIR